MIHVTLQNGSTAIFDPTETIWVCDDLFGKDADYISGESEGVASEVLKPGRHILERANDGFPVAVGFSKSKIVRIREV